MSHPKRKTRTVAASMTLVWLGASAAPAQETLECLLAKTAWTTQQESGNLEAAARSFAILARRCGGESRETLEQHAWHFVSKLKGPELRTARIDALQALYDGEFKYPNGNEPSDWWRELVQQKLALKETEAAGKILRRIEEPGVLLGMRVDKRFDDLLKAMPDKFDIAKAHERRIARYQASVAINPRSLAARNDLSRALRAAGRPREALATVESALAAGELLFEDWREQYPWVLTMRGYALLDVDEDAEGLKALAQADKVSRSGSDTASFVINLALSQAQLGQPEAALTTINRVSNTSNFGALLAANARHQAWVQLAEHAKAEDVLREIAEQQSAAPAVYLDALIRAGKTQAAKKLMLERLRDPDRRTGALIEVQTYRNSATSGGPPEQPKLSRRQELFADPEVRALILEVGRIEKFAFPEP